MKRLSIIFFASPKFQFSLIESAVINPILDSKLSITFTPIIILSKDLRSLISISLISTLYSYIKNQLSFLQNVTKVSMLLCSFKLSRKTISFRRSFSEYELVFLNCFIATLTYPNFPLYILPIEPSPISSPNSTFSNPFGLLVCLRFRSIFKLLIQAMV